MTCSYFSVLVKDAIATSDNLVCPEDLKCNQNDQLFLQRREHIQKAKVMQVRINSRNTNRVSCRPVLGGGRLPPKISYSPPKFLLTLFFTPTALGYSPPPKVLQLPPPPKGEILQEILTKALVLVMVIRTTKAWVLMLVMVIRTTKAWVLMLVMVIRTTKALVLKDN